MNNTLQLLDQIKNEPKPFVPRKKQTEVMPGEPLADDILPSTFPVTFGDPHLISTIKNAMDAQVLFSRHLRMVLK